MHGIGVPSTETLLLHPYRHPREPGHHREYHFCALHAALCWATMIVRKATVPSPHLAARLGLIPVCRIWCLCLPANYLATHTPQECALIGSPAY